MSTPVLTPAQRRAQAEADRRGASLVTMIDGRVAIILPPASHEDTAEHISRVAAALEAAGLGGYAS